MIHKTFFVMRFRSYRKSYRQHGATLSLFGLIVLRRDGGTVRHPVVGVGDNTLHGCRMPCATEEKP